jgi:ribosomal protein S8
MAKTKLSKELAKKMGFDEPPLAKQYNNIWCEADIEGKHYWFRSRGERKIAYYLQLLKEQGYIKSWEYETHKFVFPDSSWLVDFTVRNNDDTFEYFEFKGLVEPDTKKKIKLVSKYYPDAQITMVMADKKGVKKLGARATSCCKRVCMLRDLTRGII